MMKPMCVVLIVATLPLLAQNPMADEARKSYDSVKMNVLKAAEKMPEDAYGFKPVDGVRTFGQLVGHVANAQYAMCSAGAGEAMPKMGNAEKLATKDELVKALTAAEAYCDKVYASAKDSDVDMVKMFGTEKPKLGWLFLNTAHLNEHYGNIVTYMRVKGLVPPSSEKRQ